MSRAEYRRQHARTRRRPSGRAEAARRIAAIGALAGCLGAVSLTPAAMTAGASVNAARDYFVDLPENLPKEQAPQRSTILAADGSKIAEFYSENRRNVRLQEIAPVARQALLAIEDDRFYQHGPIDVRGTLRAFVNNSSDTGGRQGGSTLTQQYVKNVLLNAAVTKKAKAKATEITLQRKVLEAKLAGVAEKKMSKDQILEGYLNIAYFGDGAYGIEMAAQHYFSVPASQLTLGQAAVLAGLVQNPEAYAPTKHPKAATARRNLVLARMRDTHRITRAEATAAQKAGLGLKPSVPRNGCTTSRYPFYCEWVKSVLASDPTFGPTPAERQQFLYRGGLTIKTYLRPKVADHLQKVADESLGARNSFATGITAVQPGTGEVLGFAQNRGFGAGRYETQMAIARSTFQPGSTFKPITYAAALENGFPVNGALYAPGVFRRPDMEGKITNDAKFDVGRMDANTAMARSSNTWFATLAADTGVLKVRDMAQRLGMGGLKDVSAADYSLTLGTREQSPLRMAAIYATFAAHGRSCNPVAIASMTDSDGDPVTVPSAKCHQEIRPGIADAVTAALGQTVDGPDPHRTGRALSIGRPVAAKSGTNDEYAGVWFSGYTPQLSVAAWVGDPDAPTRHKVRRVFVYGRYRTGYGAAAAGPIWQNAMKELHAGLPVRQFAPVGPAEVTGATGVAPDLRGLSVEQAIQVAHASGLDLAVAPKTAPAATAVPKDSVVSQVPAAGATIGLTGTVTVTLSAGSTTDREIPDH